jgi:hypothetical protein
MSNVLSRELKQIILSTGGSTTLSSASERARFVRNAQADLVALAYQVNTVYKPLFDALISNSELEALATGLEGHKIYTYYAATSGDASVFWDSTSERARSIKESFDVVVSELARLENEIGSYDTPTAYDDTTIWASVNTNTNNLNQLRLDTFGSNYTFDNDGQADLSYTLAQHLDAIGAFFSGYPGTGLSHTGTYPTISLVVNVSELNFDTTIAPSLITGLVARLAYIRAFIGKDTVGAEMPAFTSYGGSNTWVANGISLERNLWGLDRGLATHMTRHLSGQPDEIDGDRLDIDYTPAYYTQDTTGPLVTTIAHLTAHLRGIDNALTQMSLQQTYENGVAGTAGNIVLTSILGRLRFSDMVGPSGPMAVFRNSANQNALEIYSQGKIVLENETYLELDERSTAPSSRSGYGQVYEKTDAPGGDPELFHLDDANREAQITRDGIVKELEVGREVVSPMQLTLPAGAPPPTIVNATYAGPPDYAIQVLDFPYTPDTTAYGCVTTPVDEDGNVPTRFKAVIHFILGPYGGVYPGGTQVTWNLYYSYPAGALDPVGDGGAINTTWSTAQIMIKTGLAPASIDCHHMVDTGIRPFTVAPQGLLTFKLVRDTGHGSDWDDVAGIARIQFMWYR